MYFRIIATLVILTMMGTEASVAQSQTGAITGRIQRADGTAAVRVRVGATAEGAAEISAR